jgi:hypothetical protein
MLDGFTTSETAPQWLQRTLLPSHESGITFSVPHSQRQTVADIDHHQPFCDARE